MDAFETGLQHGLALASIPNPHALGTADHENYALGYAEGARRHGVPAPGMRLLPGGHPRTLYLWEIEILREDLCAALSIEVS